MVLKLLDQSTTLSNNKSHTGFFQENTMLSISFKAEDICNNLSTAGKKNEFDKVCAGASNTGLIVDFCTLDKQDTNLLIQVLAPVKNFQYFSQDGEKKKEGNQSKPT